MYAVGHKGRTIKFLRGGLGNFFLCMFFFVPVKHVGFFFYHIPSQDFFHTRMSF